MRTNVARNLLVAVSSWQRFSTSIRLQKVMKTVTRSFTVAGACCELRQICVCLSVCMLLKEMQSPTKLISNKYIKMVVTIARKLSSCKQTYVLIHLVLYKLSISP